MNNFSKKKGTNEVKIFDEYNASDIIGLNVILLNCVKEYCDDEGDKCISIPDMRSLSYTAAMTRCLINIPFNGKEIRNIRKIVGWSVKDMEKKLEIKAETISRWENDKYKMGGYVEKVFRIAVCEELKDKCKNVDYSTNDITYMKIKRNYENVCMMFSRIKMKIERGPSEITWEASQKAA